MLAHLPLTILRASNPISFLPFPPRITKLYPLIIRTNRYFSSKMTSDLKLRLDEFAFRQFDDKEYLGTQIPISKESFMDHLKQLIKTTNPSLEDGYAPFCKHIFVKNWISGVKVGAIKITPENSHLIESGYKARTEKELAVLCRWVSSSKVQVPDATVLDLILYSRDQVTKECLAMGNPVPSEDYDWALISIKGQNEDFELPMTPITMMRNSLGKEEGGSGVPINHASYKASVAFWEDHVSVI